MSTKGRLKRTLRRHARRAFRREGAGYLEVYVNMRQARKLRVEPERYIILIYRYCWGSGIAVMSYRNACTTQSSILWRKKR